MLKLKNVLFALVALCLSSIALAQTPTTISYQSVLRDASNNLLPNQDIGMRVSILQGSESGTEVFYELIETSTNENGLVSIEIGQINPLSGIAWSAGPYFIKTEIDPSTLGGSTYTITGTSQILTVPYAMYADRAVNVDNLDIAGDESVFDTWDKNVNDDFDGDYLNLSNTPDLTGWDTNVADDFSGDYNDLANQPDFTNWDTNNSDDFSGNYNDLTNQPDFTNWDIDVTDDFDGDYTSLSNTPDFTGWDTNVLDDFDGDYSSLSNSPDFTGWDSNAADDFDGDYTSLSNTPDFTGWDTNVSDDFDGDYGSLTNTPTDLSDFNNDVGYITTFTELDGSTTNEIQDISEVLTEGNDAGANQIKNVADPTSDQDVVTKAYMDSVVDAIYLKMGVFDVEGNQYPVVQIGDQIWMARNLRTTRSPDGLSLSSYYYPNGTPSNAVDYGILYNWSTVLNGESPSTSNPSGVQGICPDGWHLPSEDEWNQLLSNYGDLLSAGGPLKETGLAHWNTPNTAALNVHGFSAVGAGYYSGGYSAFKSVGTYWTSTGIPASSAYAYTFLYNNNSMQSANQNPSNFYSVRCVKD